MEKPCRGDLPISDYALVGDGVTSALIGMDGSVDWHCFGRFDGPAVFCRLLDADRGGYLHVAPEGGYRSTRRYVGRTNVLETEFECARGKIRLTDCMPLDTGTAPMLLRKLEGLGGHVPVRVEFFPTFDFARAPTTFALEEGGCLAQAGSSSLRLSCPVPMTVEANRATALIHVREGQTHWISLGHGPVLLDDEGSERALRSTLEAWERWAAQGTYRGPYADILLRSALVLKLLTYRATGAIVAAPTTSLPECPGGVRNWDYRFTWLRDASWVVSALMDLGYHDESMAFIDYLERLDLEHRKASVLYDVDGHRPDPEQILGHLRGYGGARPVRIGNAAAQQDQHDIYGEIVAAIYTCSERMPSMRPLRPGLWNLTVALANEAAMYWRHGDHGIWEQRGAPQHFLSSKLLCWVALDRVLKMAARDGLEAPRTRWEIERDRIREAILEDGFHRGLGSFTRAFGSADVDATALLLPSYGFLPADDPRMVATVDCVQKRLSAGPGLLYRYIVPDGFPCREGAFTACCFWLVDCLARQGRLEEARRIFEQIVAHASDLGLLSEEIWPPTGELIGNFPQAFSHLALIRAATTLFQTAARKSSGDVE